MVGFKKTLDRLNKEKEYEDKLVIDLNHFIVTNLDSISGLTGVERDLIRRNLNKIIAESTRHKFIFSELVQMVVERGEGNY